jgi:endonuclease YncB( thermonuclease family)
MVWDWPDTTIARVIDGDSLVVNVHRDASAWFQIEDTDLGFNGSIEALHAPIALRVKFHQRIRLARINAKPAKTTTGTSAKQRVVQLLTGVAFHLQTTGPYKFGDEWMGEVILDDESNLSDLLVSEGLAVYWDGSGPRPDAAEAR